MTLTITEAKAIDHARGVLERAESIPWPDEFRPVIASAATDLRDAIGIHALLLADRIGWGQFDTDLAVYADPYAVAVEKSAEAATDCAAYLAEVIGTHCGPGAAEYVSNGGELS